MLRPMTTSATNVPEPIGSEVLAFGAEAYGLGRPLEVGAPARCPGEAARGEAGSEAGRRTV
jgi:hypothetical protein